MQREGWVMSASRSLYSNVSRASDDARNALAKSRKGFAKRQRRMEKNKRKDEWRELKNLQPPQGVNDSTKIKVESA
ncbi:hypothetical protein LTR70_004273 [Exophiala xenobiotica]|uniref:Uncharacterized protein n=1 Tax=Lithohypha guttulata TaxID=1690604 RepID=A0ABR0KEA2_9EURO|nr:hypothetical protein LTR24_003760 [Lithohypha guttulata]KAK5321028.1 hypothetical protein LTR70_004273 [Exophiala xenobiotica]